MKKLYFLFLLISFLFFRDLYSQVDCSAPYSLAETGGNNIAAFHGIGDLWFDGQVGKFEFPKQDISAVQAFGAGGFWISAKDENNNLKVSGQTFERAQGRTSFWAGPGKNISSCTFWDRQFIVTAADINKFRNDFSDGSIDEEIPFSLLFWPARANPYIEDLLGVPVPELPGGLAPFFDHDQDGFYDPMKGDMPLTLGASSTMFWIMNDYSGLSSFDQTSSAIAVTSYNFSSNEDEALNNSIFYDVKVSNLSQQTNTDFIFSIWYDSALGCPDDDFQGCIPGKDLAFVYNQDDKDGSTEFSCIQGINTYADRIPVMGIKMLRGGFYENDGDIMNSHMVYNDLFGTFPLNSYPPANAPQYRNYMEGYWNDGSPVLQNGKETKFMYAGNPAAVEEEGNWTMCSEETISARRDVVTSFKPIDIPPGAVADFQFVVTGEENVAHPCPDISALISNTDRLKEFWYNKLLFPVSTEKVVHNEGLLVKPNPMSESALLSLLDGNSRIKSISIYDALGRKVFEEFGLTANEYLIQGKDLPKGLNMILLSTDNGELYSHKLIVQ